MIYIDCPTCGTCLSSKIEEYEKRKEELYNDVEISDAQKKKESKKLLDGLKLHRYCCRMRMITYVDIAKFMK